MAKSKRKPPDLIDLRPYDSDLIKLPDIPDLAPLQPKLIAPQDRKVPRVKSMSVHEGWRTKVVRELASASIGSTKRKNKKGKTVEEKQHFTYWTPAYTIYISPQGDEYVDAHGNEKADLLHVGVTRMGKAPRRLRRLATSHHHKQSRKEAQLLERGRKAAKQKLKQKKQKVKHHKTLSRRAK